jgi:hypothetical protein
MPQDFDPLMQAPELDDPRRWLFNTALLQFDHPKIRLLAKRLTQLKGGHREKALACFAHVRSLPFGCIADSAGTTYAHKYAPTKLI